MGVKQLLWGQIPGSMQMLSWPAGLFEMGIWKAAPQLLKSLRSTQGAKGRFYRPVGGGLAELRVEEFFRCLGAFQGFLGIFGRFWVREFSVPGSRL